MSEPKFVYVTYIVTTPERLWQALTEGAFTERYWFGTRVESEWTPGAPVSFRRDGELSDSGHVLKCEPFRLLSYTFHVEFHEVFRRERPSRVTFELEPMGSEVQLTVTHDDFDPGSKVLEAVGNGWPLVLASLKSLIETGSPLSAASAQAAERAKEKAVAQARGDAA
jgi:uncharacterized protein YndB with AHSA1/START domain